MKDLTDVQLGKILDELKLSLRGPLNIWRETCVKEMIKLTLKTVDEGFLADSTSFSEMTDKFAHASLEDRNSPNAALEDGNNSSVEAQIVN